MKFNQRRAILLILTLLALSVLIPSGVFAQDATPEATPNATAEIATTPEVTPEAAAATPEVSPATGTRVSGSGIVAGIFDALVASGGVDGDFTRDIIGTNQGLQRFCAGQTDIALSTRPLSLAEESICTSSGIEFVEVLLGTDALAFVIHPGLTQPTCLTQSDLNTIFATSAANTVTNWSEITPDALGGVGMTVVVPPETAPAYVALDALVAGDGLRRDAVTADSYAAVIERVAQTPGAIGVVGLGAVSGDFSAQASGVRVLELNNPETNACFVPSAASVESATYATGSRLFMLVRSTALGAPGVTALVEYALSPEGRAAVLAAGFAPVTETALAAVTDPTATGRRFSRDLLAFQLDPIAAGSVLVAGSPELSDFVTEFNAALNAESPSLTVTANMQGDTAALRQFCNGELDVLLITSALSDETRANCAANDIVPVELDLGSRAVVVLTSGDGLECLTLAQLTAAVSAQPADVLPQTWDAIDETLPQLPIILVAPDYGAYITDLLLLEASGSSLPRREAAETSDDIRYRATAVGNAEGVITYMTWSDYELVLAAGITPRLASIDSGTGCVAPTLETIADGSYGLSRTFRVVARQTSLDIPGVQNFVFYLYSDAVLAVLENNHFVGLTFEGQRAVRQQLETIFEEARAAAEIAASATPEVTPEAGADAGAEATPEATP